ncbi:protein-glutamate O-methyltransferase CheR [Nocardioides panacihumi]|uniref:protein-glutamate O-methyltransferase n=1 Tax=Nocardioides panacihumi TaxID=400774 RepID=A0ABN2QTG3_9ACTN
MTISSSSFHLIAALVRRETAMVYEAGKEYLVEARLTPLATAAGCPDVEAYIARVSTDLVERRKALDALTINETSWFRDQTPYQAFTDSILPRLLESRAATRRLRIWSAACSSGQEAYSIAMLLDQHLPAGWTAEILATDVSTAMLDRVRAGRYSQVEMNRGLPATTLVRYFTRAGTEWEVSPELRRTVRTQHLNLADAYAFTAVGTYDVVLLRNVLIYFDHATKYDILRRMRPHVAPDGFLLLGSSETTLDMPADVAALWSREQLGRVQAHRPAVAVPLASSTRIGA